MIGRFIQETNVLLEQEKFQEVYDLCNQELTNYENLGHVPSDEESYYIATIYSTMARVLEGKDALKCLDCAISFFPNSASLYYQRAGLRTNISDFKGAISDYNIIVENSPSADAYLYRAIAKFSMKDYKGVVADCSKALEMNKDLVHAYSFRAEAKMQMKDYESALHDFKTVLIFDSENQGAKKAIIDLEKCLIAQ